MQKIQKIYRCAYIQSTNSENSEKFKEIHAYKCAYI